MDLREELMREHSKAQALKLAAWIGTDSERFAELMRLFFGDEYRVTQRAAWVVSHCADEHPELVKPWHEKLIGVIDSDNHVAVRRNAVRVLVDQELPESLWGEVVDKCMACVADPNEAVAVRRYSMEVVWNICQKIPELAQELRIILEDNVEYGTAGFKSYGRKLLKAMNKRGW
ncbi:MAG: hypothetical protein GYB31_02365 [Bacteroidetes bacterium]|nr:hypothetical protein [Bacteroidota bacterium]